LAPPRGVRSSALVNRSATPKGLLPAAIIRLMDAVVVPKLQTAPLPTLGRWIIPMARAQAMMAI
jgi:hypothetical protein